MTRQIEQEKNSSEGLVSAAKLHVLGLRPLKLRLGSRWDRLSALVHRLVEKAIRRAQGPGDHCIILDELSYAVTFGNLSVAEASQVCAAIAREVCEHLFGDQIDEVSVRSIVAEIAMLSSIDSAECGLRIEALVEKQGIESVITHSVESGRPDPVVVMAGKRSEVAKDWAGAVKIAQAHFAPFGLKIGLLPIWDLQRRTSNCLFVTPFSGDALGAGSSGKLARSGASDSQILDLEIDQLTAASCVSQNLHMGEKICAVGVGVSYTSINSFRARIQYLTALQKLRFFAKNPLLLKIEQIPDGAPAGRVDELVAMLASPNVRLTLEFQNLATISTVDLAQGPIGIGGILPPHLDAESATNVCRRLVHYASAHKVFAFLDHLDMPERAGMAANEGVKFGMGGALSRRVRETLEHDIAFPLRPES